MIRILRRQAGKVKRSLLRNFEKIFSRIAPGLFLALFPVKSVIIEPTNICNLRCPLCPSFKSNRVKGKMSLNDFKIIVQKLPLSTRTVHLYLSGEPLINDECFKMISILKEKNLNTSMSTNGTLLEQKIDEILDSQLSELIIGLDGATEKTYKKYRIGGNFSKVIANIRLLTKEKQKRKLHHPTIVLQFIVMKHTEKEVGQIKRLARQLEVDELSLISVSLGTHNMTDRERRSLANQYLPEDSSFSRYETQSSNQVKAKWDYEYCPLWRQPVILWNGDVTVCCFDHNGLEIYGNVLKQKWDTVWHGEKHYHAIKRVITRKMGICKSCGITSGDENKTYILSH